MSKKSTKTSTSYGRYECKNAVWNSAKKIRGGNPSKIRQDSYGNKISYNSYGKNTKMGWQIDHIKPQSRGGSHNIRNLQALNTKINITKGNSLIKASRHSKSNR